jgi:uncharacterized membrane protein
MLSEEKEHKEMRELIEKNSKLIKENQRILKKLYHYTVAGIWLKVLWYIVLIGLPFALYFYVLEPYFHAFGTSFETFKEGINQLPGVKSIDILINSAEMSSTTSSQQ